MGETATRILLGFVIVTGVVIVVGVVALGWLIATGAHRGSARSTDRPATLPLQAGSRIVSMARGPDDLALLVEAADGRQILRLVDPATGATLQELPVVPAVPNP
jgi:hypothetical protein